MAAPKPVAKKNFEKIVDLIEIVINWPHSRPIKKRHSGHPSLSHTVLLACLLYSVDEAEMIY